VSGYVDGATRMLVHDNRGEVEEAFASRSGCAYQFIVYLIDGRRVESDTRLTYENGIVTHGDCASRLRIIRPHRPEVGA
jgi:hypothetical protein